MIDSIKGLRATSIDDPFGENETRTVMETEGINHDQQQVSSQKSSSLFHQPRLQEKDTPRAERDSQNHEDEGMDIGQSLEPSGEDDFDNNDNNDDGDIRALHPSLPVSSRIEDHPHTLRQSSDLHPINLQKELPDSPEITPTQAVFPVGISSNGHDQERETETEAETETSLKDPSVSSSSKSSTSEPSKSYAQPLSSPSLTSPPLPPASALPSNSSRLSTHSHRSTTSSTSSPGKTHSRHPSNGSASFKPPIPKSRSILLHSPQFQAQGQTLSYPNPDHNPDPDPDLDLTPTDPSVPFESIPLSTTPPPPASVPLPSTPRSYNGNGIANGSSNGNGKRGSWGGFGVNAQGERIAFGSPPVHHSVIDSQSHSRRSSVASGSGTSSPHLTTTNTTTTPQLHAPPAHPHPFPLPTSPPLISSNSNSKRLSTTSVNSSSSSSHGGQGQGQGQGQAQANGTGTGPGNGNGLGLGPGHGHGLGIKGISTFEKVISQTRPSWLPPKPKEEDEAHYSQWSEMMHQSKEAEQHRLKRQEQARLEREKRLAISTPYWESLISSPDFTSNKINSDPLIRKMWFEGIPPRLRGVAWSKMIGNPLALNKDAFRSYDIRAKKALDSGRFPKDILEKLEMDLDETVVTLKLFQRGGAMREDLKELVCAWVVYRSDEGLGYAPYITLPSAMLLLTLPVPQAFLCLLNLLSRPCLSAFYRNNQPDIDAFYRVFENLQADSFPKIYANCKNLGIRVPESWFRSLLIDQIPFEVSCRLWDQIVLDGDGYIFRAALAIFGFLEPRLHYPDYDEILSVLEGHNKATLAITTREKERAKLRGEAWTDGLDGKLSVFGLDEAALFGWLENDGWKESRFERLVQRELPD